MGKISRKLQRQGDLFLLLPIEIEEIHSNIKRMFYLISFKAEGKENMQKLMPAIIVVHTFIRAHRRQRQED